MDKSSISSYRSRRRRASLALFGRSRQRTAMTEILPDARWRYEERVIDAIPGGDHHAAPAPTREAEAEAASEHELRAVVARLQREARSDRRLCARLAEAELDRLIEQTARTLWAESRVTAFVPLLTMRRVHEALGLAGASPEADAFLLDA